MVLVEGGEAKGLTHGPAYHSEPAFSPDGSKVAFTMDFEGNLEIGVVDVAGGTIKRLTTNADLDFAPDWSADGNRTLRSSTVPLIAETVAPSQWNSGGLRGIS